MSDEPMFLRLSSVEGVPQEIAEILTLDSREDEAWLIVHCGYDFIAKSEIGDFMTEGHHMSQSHIVVRLGRQWPRPELKAGKPDEDKTKLREWKRKRRKKEADDE